MELGSLSLVAVVGRCRGALLERSVWSMLVVVLDVLVDDASEVTSAEDEDAIQAFAAYRPDPAFRERVRDRRPHRRLDDGDLFGDEDRVERGLELGVAIADQEPARATEAFNDVAGGLRRPGAGRMLGDPSDVDASRVEFDEEQHVVAPQDGSVDGEEVTRNHMPGLRAQEVPPRLATPCRGVEPGMFEDLPYGDAARLSPRPTTSP